MAEITLIIPAVPPSMNEFAGRQNCQEYRDLKARWTQIVAIAGRCKRPPRPFNKSMVTIRYRFKDRRRRDPDNYNGKMLMDGLTRSGIIVDDSFSHVQLLIAAEPDPGEPRTTIIIREL